MGSIHTANGFYMYNYLGDGVFKVNFAIPINSNEDLIGLIYKAIDNGTINSPRSLDSFIEEVQSGQGGDNANIVNALAERRWYKGLYILGSSRQGRNTRGVSYVSEGNSRPSSSRGADGRNNGQEIQPVDGKTKLSLKEDVALILEDYDIDGEVYSSIHDVADAVESLVYESEDD